MLRDLPKVDDPNLLVGIEHSDDAGVYRLDDSTALVLTVDFFPPLVDDPYDYGRIAAANSLSDVYAMGGRPLTALNIVGFPDRDLPVEMLSEILRGGAERVAAAGAVIVGGHTVRDAEVKYGLSVTGVVHPNRIVTNGGAKPGDVLVLTKPLGTGVLTMTAKNEVIPQSALAQAIDVMADLNAAACAAMLEVGAHAATDITGFGLLGHAFEMASASNTTIELFADKVPLLDDTLRLAREGIITRACRSNLDYLKPHIDTTNIDETMIKILGDAQTSGGLLIAVAEAQADQLMERLRALGTRASAVVGKVGEFRERSIRVR